MCTIHVALDATTNAAWANDGGRKVDQLGDQAHIPLADDEHGLLRGEHYQQGQSDQDGKGALGAGIEVREGLIAQVQLRAFLQDFESNEVKLGVQSPVMGCLVSCQSSRETVKPHESDGIK